MGTKNPTRKVQLMVSLLVDNVTVGSFMPEQSLVSISPEVGLNSEVLELKLTGHFIIGDMRHMDPMFGMPHFMVVRADGSGDQSRNANKDRNVPPQSERLLGMVSSSLIGFLEFSSLCFIGHQFLVLVDTLGGSESTRSQTSSSLSGACSNTIDHYEVCVRLMKCGVFFEADEF